MGILLLLQEEAINTLPPAIEFVRSELFCGAGTTVQKVTVRNKLGKMGNLDKAISRFLALFVYRCAF